MPEAEIRPVTPFQASGGEEPPLSLDARQLAESAVLRAEGVLKFAKPDDPVWQELRRLYEAVAPIVQSDAMAG